MREFAKPQKQPDSRGRSPFAPRPFRPPSAVVRRMLIPDKCTTPGYDAYDDFIMEDVKVLEVIHRAPKVTGMDILPTVTKRAPLYVIKDAAYFEKWVHDPETDDTMSYRSFLSSTEWKTWNHDTFQRSGAGKAQGTSSELPPSTLKLPEVLYTVTNVRHLSGIAAEGLNTHYAGKSGLGAAHGAYEYAPRDMYLKAIWLGTDPSVGREMKGSLEDEDLFDLVVITPESFKIAFMRDINAVLHGDPNTNGTTVLCFESIPSEYIYYEGKSGNLEKLAENAELLEAYKKGRLMRQEILSSSNVSAPPDTTPSIKPQEKKEEEKVLKIKELPKMFKQYEEEPSDDDSGWDTD